MKCVDNNASETIGTDLFGAADAAVKEFFLKYVERKLPASCKLEGVYKCVIDLAWNDAAIYERRYHKDGLICAHEEEIKEAWLLSLSKPDSLLYKAEESFADFCKEHPACSMRLGFWQKLVNMTFKYLICLNHVFYLTSPDIPVLNWSACECPIDTHIAKVLYRKALSDEDAEIAWKVATSSKTNDENYSWNYFSVQTYEALQKMIREYCNVHGLHSPLYFDFLYWK